MATNSTKTMFLFLPCILISALPNLQLLNCVARKQMIDQLQPFERIFMLQKFVEN